MLNTKRLNKNIFIRRLANVYASDTYVELWILIFYTIVTDLTIMCAADYSSANS